MLALAAIYFWALVRPDLMPPRAVLIIGLLEDLLSGGPPGLWASGFVRLMALADASAKILAGFRCGRADRFRGSTLLAAMMAYVLTGLSTTSGRRWHRCCSPASSLWCSILDRLPVGWTHSSAWSRDAAAKV